ncbi:MAG: hypothetical protein AABX29_09890 [Nanoarchaeota archaeon]
MISKEELFHALESHGYSENLARSLTDEYYNTKDRGLNLFKVILSGIPIYASVLYDKYHHLIPKDITNKVDPINDFLLLGSSLATMLLLLFFAKKEARIERIVNGAMDYSTGDKPSHLPL